MNFSDSPKFRNKAQNNNNLRNNRNALTKRTILAKTKAKSIAHDIVVVREANKKVGLDRDPDMQRLQVIIKKLQRNYKLLLEKTEFCYCFTIPLTRMQGKLT